MRSAATGFLKRIFIFAVMISLLITLAMLKIYLLTALGRSSLGGF